MDSSPRYFSIEGRKKAKKWLFLNDISKFLFLLKIILFYKIIKKRIKGIYRV